MTRSPRRRQAYPDEPRSDPWPLVVVVLGAVLLALLGMAGFVLLTGGPQATPIPSASVPASPSPTSTSPSSPSPEPTGSASLEPSAGPTPTPSAAASVTPGASPSPSPTDSASATPDPATLCTGTDENRDFFRSAALSMPWAVYCGSLPGGWTLSSGSYRGSNGGWLFVAYRGPGGTSLFLREGNLCASDQGCLPEGTDIGPAKFGDLDGMLRSTEGGYAVVVEVSDRLAYALEAIGVGADGTRVLAEDLVRIP